MNGKDGQDERERQAFDRNTGWLHRKAGPIGKQHFANAAATETQESNGEPPNLVPGTLRTH